MRTFWFPAALRADWRKFETTLVDNVVVAKMIDQLPTVSKGVKRGIRNKKKVANFFKNSYPRSPEVWIGVVCSYFIRRNYDLKMENIGIKIGVLLILRISTSDNLFDFA